MVKSDGPPNSAPRTGRIMSDEAPLTPNDRSVRIRNVLEENQNRGRSLWRELLANYPDAGSNVTHFWELCDEAEENLLGRQSHRAEERREYGQGGRSILNVDGDWNKVKDEMRTFKEMNESLLQELDEKERTKYDNQYHSLKKKMQEFEDGLVRLFDMRNIVREWARDNEGVGGTNTCNTTQRGYDIQFLLRQVKHATLSSVSKIMGKAFDGFFWPDSTHNPCIRDERYDLTQKVNIFEYPCTFNADYSAQISITSMRALLEIGHLPQECWQPPTPLNRPTTVCFFDTKFLQNQDIKQTKYCGRIMLPVKLWTHYEITTMCQFYVVEEEELEGIDFIIGEDNSAVIHLMENIATVCNAAGMQNLPRTNQSECRIMGAHLKDHDRLMFGRKRRWRYHQEMRARRFNARPQPMERKNEGTKERTKPNADETNKNITPTVTKDKDETNDQRTQKGSKATKEVSNDQKLLDG